MIRIHRTDPDRAVVTFVVTDVRAYGRVSVVGSFNNWTPGLHELEADSHGTGTIDIAVPVTEDVHFRYLGSDGAWFDEPDADEHTPYGSVIRRDSLDADADADADADVDPSVESNASGRHEASASPPSSAQTPFTWRQSEPDDLPDMRPVTARSVREGWVADPNLGDVPTDEQPHPGSSAP